MKSMLVQLGNNPDYPRRLNHFWKYTEKSKAPEWITDNARIEEFNEFPVLSIERGNDGSISILSSETGKSLVNLPNEDSYVIWSENLGYKGLTEKQLWLLYEKE